MRKIFKFVMMVLLISLIIFIFYKNSLGHKKQELYYIDMVQFEEKIKNKENIIFMVSRKECTLCRTMKKKINSTNLLINSPIYCLEYDKSNCKEVVPKLEKYLKNINSVPYLGKIENGKLISSMENFKDLKDIKLWLKNI